MRGMNHIDGIVCVRHRVELTVVADPSKPPALYDPLRRHMKEQGERHSRENGGCKLVPWRTLASYPS